MGEALKKQTASALKVSPLYEGDTSVDLSDPFYSESNMAHLMRGVAALNSGKGVEHDLIEDDIEDDIY